MLTAIDRPERVSALRALSIPGLNSLLYELVMLKKPDKSLGSLRFMGHPSETLAKLPPELSDCYFCFQQLPNYKISSLSLMRRINTLRGSRPDVLLHEEELSRIQQPTMFLWGTRDPFGSVETGRKIASCFQQPEFHSIQNAGHLPWLDQPEECGRLAVKCIEHF